MGLDLRAGRGLGLIWSAHPRRCLIRFLQAVPRPDPNLNPPEKSIPDRKLNTHSVLLPQLLVQSGAHNLSLDRGRSGEVGLSALATVVSDGCE